MSRRLTFLTLLALLFPLPPALVTVGLRLAETGQGGWATITGLAAVSTAFLYGLLWVASRQNRPVETAPTGSVPIQRPPAPAASAVVPGRWRGVSGQANSLMAMKLGALSLLVAGMLCEFGPAALAGPAGIPMLLGSAALALVAGQLRRADRHPPAHADAVMAMGHTTPARPAAGGRGPLGAVSAPTSCESCRSAPASVRVVFTDGAVFLVCPGCAGGALGQTRATDGGFGGAA
jgi:hypothetical protein